MREIKFRAWNTKQEFMDTAWLIDWEHGIVCHSKHNKSTIEDCVIMQYTGLKDKNEREIFEGDLIDFYDFWDEITGGYAEGKSRVGKVEYIGTGFFVTDIKDEEYESDLFLLKINDDELEVVGNIHENPDLLNTHSE